MVLVLAMQLLVIISVHRTFVPINDMVENAISAANLIADPIISTSLSNCIHNASTVKIW